MPLSPSRRRHLLSLVATTAAWLASRAAYAEGVPPLVAVDVRLDRPIVLVDVAGGSGAPGRSAARHAYLRLRLAPQVRPDGRLAALNLALVVDREAIQTPVIADAVREVVGTLGPRDVVAVVGYGEVVEVLRPAEPDRAGARAEQLPLLQLKGPAEAALGAGDASSRGTNLFGGVAKGAAEIRKYLGSGRVSHVLVIASRPPGVGPREPRALSELGAALARDGIGLTVVDSARAGGRALRALAAGGGGRYIAGPPHALGAQLLDAVRQMRAVRGRDLGVEIRFPGAVSPIRVLGTPTAEIVGRVVRARLGDVRPTGGGELFARLDTTLCEPGRRRIGEVHVRYFDVLEGREVASVTPLEVLCAVGEPQAGQVDFEVAASVAMAIGEDARAEARAAMARGQTEQAALALAVALEELRELMSGPLSAADTITLIDGLESELRALRERIAREASE
jgi:hypothetical protein